MRYGQQMCFIVEHCAWSFKGKAAGAGYNDTYLVGSEAYW